MKRESFCCNYISVVGSKKDSIKFEAICSVLLQFHMVRDSMDLNGVFVDDD